MKSLTCFSSRSRGTCCAVILERLAENCRGRTTAIICTRTNAPKYILESHRLHFGSICDQNGRNFEPWLLSVFKKRYSGFLVLNLSYIIYAIWTWMILKVVWIVVQSSAVTFHGQIIFTQCLQVHAGQVCIGEAFSKLAKYKRDSGKWKMLTRNVTTYVAIPIPQRPRAADEELRPACLEAEQWTVFNTTGCVRLLDI